MALATAASVGSPSTHMRALSHTRLLAATSCGVFSVTARSQMAPSVLTMRSSPRLVVAAARFASHVARTASVNSKKVLTQLAPSLPTAPCKKSTAFAAPVCNHPLPLSSSFPATRGCEG